MFKPSLTSRNCFGWFLALVFAGSIAAGEADSPKAKANPNPDRIGPPPVEKPSTARSVTGRARTVGVPIVPSKKVRKFTPFIPPANYSPPIIFVPQPRFDYGTVYKGETVQHRFVFENRGGAPLLVKNVRASCGCTVINQASMDKVLAPGATGGFELRIETSRLRAGRQSKYADITTNDPKAPSTRVYIQGNVETILRVQPTNPKIVSVRGAGIAETEITLTKTVQEDVKILEAKSKTGRLVLTLKEVQPGTIYKLLVKTNYPKEVTQSYFSEHVDLSLQVGERKLDQNFYVSVQLKNRIETNPRMVYFRRTDFQPLKEKGTPAKKLVTIKAALEEPYNFKITSFKADSPDPFFKINVEPVKEGREYHLTVTVDKLPEIPTTQRYKSLKGNIKLLTDDETLPEINLRCVAFF